MKPSKVKGIKSYAKVICGCAVVWVDVILH